MWFVKKKNAYKTLQKRQGTIFFVMAYQRMKVKVGGGWLYDNTEGLKGYKGKKSGRGLVINLSATEILHEGFVSCLKSVSTIVISCTKGGCWKVLGPNHFTKFVKRSDFFNVFLAWLSISAPCIYSANILNLQGSQ